MSYVEKHLMPGEQIEYRANLHWLVFLLPILLFIVAIWLFFVGSDIAKVFALILIVGVFVTALGPVIERRTSEFAVTNKRVLILRSPRWKCPTRHNYAIWHRAQLISLAGTATSLACQLNQQFCISQEQLEQIRQLRGAPEPEQLQERNNNER